MEPSDREIIDDVLKGNTAAFEPLVKKYSPQLFSTARRYARYEREVEDIVQEVWVKAFSKLHTFQGHAPFEHWLMRLAVRTCYDFLRQHQRNREAAISELSEDETHWLDQVAQTPEDTGSEAEAAKQLVRKLLERLSPSARLVITLLEIEERSVREISELTGWSVPLVKVRAFRARAEMKRLLSNLTRDKYL